MSNEVSVANSLLDSVLNLPGFKVNRQKFLYEILTDKNLSNSEIDKIIEGKITDVLSISEIDKLAKNRIFKHKTKVTAVSAALGIPGGVAMIASAPADVAQFYYYSGILSQELAYLYGFNDLWETQNNDLTFEGKEAMVLFIGTMLGVGAASQVVKEITIRLSKHVPDKLMKQALTKTLIYQVTRKVLKYIGIKLTKEGFSKTIGKAIPFVGAAISGGLTYYSFGEGANRLQSKLSEAINEKDINSLDDIIDIDAE